jgi:E3 ubiquitin-protein ligase CCNP1IP1
MSQSHLKTFFLELERDLELERRKVRELQEGSRERDREYAKLKVCFSYFN